MFVVFSTDRFREVMASGDRHPIYGFCMVGSVILQIFFRVMYPEVRQGFNPAPEEYTGVSHNSCVRAVIYGLCMVGSVILQIFLYPEVRQGFDPGFLEGCR
jgi:cytochrome bd-type quinol oxidase subunit 2